MAIEAVDGSAGRERECVELWMPVDRDFEGVARMVLGGIGDRLDLGLDEIDDVQLAIERVLAEAIEGDTARMSFELGDGILSARVGPLSARVVAVALEDPPSAPGELTLRRVLETVVDGFEIEHPDGETITLRLEKTVRPGSRG